MAAWARRRGSGHAQLMVSCMSSYSDKDIPQSDRGDAGTSPQSVKPLTAHTEKWPPSSGIWPLLFSSDETTDSSSQYLKKRAISYVKKTLVLALLEKLEPPPALGPRAPTGCRPHPSAALIPVGLLGPRGLQFVSHGVSQLSKFWTLRCLFSRIFIIHKHKSEFSEGKTRIFRERFSLSVVCVTTHTSSGNGSTFQEAPWWGRSLKCGNKDRSPTLLSALPVSEG